MVWLGVILKLWSFWRVIVVCNLFLNLIKVIFGFVLIMWIFLKFGNCWNKIWIVKLVVLWGKFCIKRMLFGGVGVLGIIGLGGWYCCEVWCVEREIECD